MTQSKRRMKMMDKWVFIDPPETSVVTTKQVTNSEYPVLYVSHELDEDGETVWQFLCLVVPFSMEDAQLVRLDTIVNIDNTLREVADLPLGYAATRDFASGPWKRFKDSTEG